MGDPDLYFVKVNCTEDQFDCGDHYDIAKATAINEGYDEPLVAFDEYDPAGRAMLPLFHWDSASVIESA